MECDQSQLFVRFSLRLHLSWTDDLNCFAIQLSNGVNLTKSHKTKSTEWQLLRQWIQLVHPYHCNLWWQKLQGSSMLLSDYFRRILTDLDQAMLCVLPQLEKEPTNHSPLGWVLEGKTGFHWISHGWWVGVWLRAQRSLVFLSEQYTCFHSSAMALLDASWYG